MIQSTSQSLATVKFSEIKLSWLSFIFDKFMTFTNFAKLPKNSGKIVTVPPFLFLIFE